MSKSMRFLRYPLAGLAACILAGSAALAAPVVSTDLSFQGSFKLASKYADYGWGSLVYTNQAGQDRLCYSSYSYMRASSVPALLDPAVVGWGSLNVATDLAVSASGKPLQVGGAYLAGDGMIYGIGRNNSASSGWQKIAPSLDQSTYVAIGQDMTTTVSGATAVPAGFVAAFEAKQGKAAGTYSGYDTLICNNGNNAISLTLSGPTLPLVSGKVPSTSVFRLTSGTNTNWHYDTQDMYWMSDPANPNDWTQARLMAVEKDTLSTSPTYNHYFLDFYDPQGIINAMAWNGKPQTTPTTGILVDQLDVTSYLNSAGPVFQVNGLAFDPATGRLFVGECDSSSTGVGYVHVFNVVPEPATLCLLAMGGLFVLRRRTAPASAPK